MNEIGNWKLVTFLSYILGGLHYCQVHQVDNDKADGQLACGDEGSGDGMSCRQGRVRMKVDPP